MFHQPDHSHRPNDYEPRVREGSSRAYVIGIAVAGAAIFGAYILLTSPVEQTDPLSDVSDAEIESVAGSWVNQLGLTQTDTDVWRARLTDACTEAVRDPEIALELADRYVTEDWGTFSGSDAVEPPATADAADTLWTMAVQVCRDSFPAGAIDAGPPSAVLGGQPSP